MLYEIATQLEAALQAKGYDIDVRYTERGERDAPAEERIVIGHERAGGVERFSATVGPGGNPRPAMTRTSSAVLRIYGQSTVAGAAIQDHERQVEAWLEPVLVELRKILRQRRQVDSIADWSGGFIEPEAQAGTEVWPGAVYELRFAVPRAVFDRNRVGAGRPTVTITKKKNTTRIDGDGDAETACGA